MTQWGKEGDFLPLWASVLKLPKPYALYQLYARVMTIVPKRAMIDCSRNGILLVESVYFMLRNMALMGLNTLQLYTEDTYEACSKPSPFRSCMALVRMLVIYI